MDYLVLSMAVTDELYLADGSHMPHVAGGAGIYALAGMKVWQDNVGIVTGVGADYLDLYGAWYTTNHLSTQGLIVKDAHTPHNVIRYFENGERSETPRYGLSHYQKIEGTPQDLAQFCGNVKGVYVFKNAAQPFWDEILALKKKYQFQLMWEIGADATIPENLALIQSIARQVDVFSINRAEAQCLLSADDEKAAIAKLLEWKLPMIYLRVGSRGAYVLANGDATLIPSVENCAVMDVTGGGNSSSGGAFVGFCESGDAIRAGRMGNISASVCIAQYGVPVRMDWSVREKAVTLLNRMEAKDEK